MCTDHALARRPSMNYCCTSSQAVFRNLDTQGRSLEGVSHGSIEEAGEILLTPKSVTLPGTPRVKPERIMKDRVRHEQAGLSPARPCFATSLSQVGLVSRRMFTSKPIEDTVLLAVTLIDAALLAILLLSSLYACTPAVRSYILSLLLLVLLALIFLHEQLLDISDPLIQHLTH